MTSAQQSEVERARGHLRVFAEIQRLAAKPGPRDVLFASVSELLLASGELEHVWLDVDEGEAGRIVRIGLRDAAEHADHAAGAGTRELPLLVDGAAVGLLGAETPDGAPLPADLEALLAEVAALLAPLVTSNASGALAPPPSSPALSSTKASAQRPPMWIDAETLPAAYRVYDETGRFVRWNRAFEDALGWTTEELRDTPALGPFGVTDPEVLTRRIDSLFAEGRSVVESAIPNRHGGKVPYVSAARPWTEDGVRQVVALSVDVRRLRHASEVLLPTEARYRGTLDHTLEGCQLLGFDWRYLYLNPAAAVQNKKPNDELIGRTMMECWPGIEATEVFASIRRCLEQRKPSQQDVHFFFADGSSGWFDVRVQPVPEGAFVLSLDITERKTKDDALHALNDSLEAKIAERTAEVEAARAKAELADRLKSSFLATMSHELRTPLNSILGFTGIVLKGLAGPLTSEQTKQLSMVQGSSRHLLDLINDVLDISKIEAGQLEVRLAPFDLRASIERVVASVRPLADKKGITLAVDVPDELGPMTSDKRRVEQVLINLLNNAIKFTEQGGVRLVVMLGPDPDASSGEAPRPLLRVRIADTGIGMKPEDMLELFQPFRQIDAGLERQHEGTGLGLAICRRLVGLLGGKIRVESRWGEGSTFTVVLPTTKDTEA